jgi:hypothetical protein
MNWVRYKLKKLLAEEKKWLSYKSLIGSGDPKIKAGVKMAQERIPQLELALKLIELPAPKVKSKKKSNSTTKQLHLWQNNKTNPN